MHEYETTTILKISNSINFTSNIATLGGALFLSNVTFILEMSCNFINNSASNGGNFFGGVT